ncbi:BirA family transcriptional regulator [Parelusimicrobium proximum]|uniref:biotin--[acetyl-CoA-carboxylase] ligase n=1 Tax=Parelusimicrobium proximum TaxID=3228953 RepID=UPI003D17DD5D
MGNLGKILHFQSLPSTNLYAKENAADLSNASVILADMQTFGRGRKDRAWVSEEGGLYFTILLKPAKTDFLPNLTQLMSLAVCKALEDLGIKAEIKWPNDVQVSGRKIAGILSEAVMQKNKLYALALGCGVNISQTDIKVEGRETISVKKLGVNVEREDFLKCVLKYFFTSYAGVIENGFEEIRREYLSRAANIGKQVSVNTGTETVTGIMKRISDDGHLVLETKDVVEKEIIIGDIL